MLQEDALLCPKSMCHKLENWALGNQSMLLYKSPSAGLLHLKVYKLTQSKFLHGGVARYLFSDCVY